MNSASTIKRILAMNSLAVVGFSPKQERPSHLVSMYLKSCGYKITPVNPGHHEIAGMKCFPNLLSISVSIDVAIIFRKSKFVPDIVNDAILIGAKAIWMQDGIRNKVSCKLAKDRGLKVIMDDCILRQHQKLKN